MNRPDAPLVTIGITSYNARPLIDRAIRSALAQDWPNFEILIVDDGSSDGSQEYLASLAATDVRIRFVARETNGGCGAARNTLLHNARGDYICFFDDDDESFPSRVRDQYERLTAYMAAHRGSSPVYAFVSRIVRLNEDPSTDKIVLSASHAPPEPSGRDFIDYLFLNAGNPSLTWGQTGIGTCMARLSNFTRFGGFDETFRRGEEWDFFIRAAFEDAAFISTPEPLMIQHITHTDDKGGRAALDFALRLRHVHKRYLQGRGIYLASICAAHARFNYAKRHAWQSRLWTALTCILSPSVALKYMVLRKSR